MFAGIDIGGTSIKGVITDSECNIITSGQVHTPDGAEEIDLAIAGLINDMARDSGIRRNRIRAAGIGAAGAVDNRKGLVITSPNIPAWKNHPLAKNIKELTRIKVVLENDATVATAGAWLQNNIRGMSNWIMVTLGTGIGGGAVIENRIYTGQNGSSLEIGHMTIDINGRECPCGNRGCLERYASATALVQTALQHMASDRTSSLHRRTETGRLTSKIIYEEACAGDPLALKSFNEISTYLGYGMVNLINIFNPQAVVFGGGLSQAYRLIFPVVKSVVREHAMNGLKERTRFIHLRQQSRMSAMGAARMAIEHLRYSY